MARSGRGRRTPVPVGLFLGWTLFVWVGRIRNALTDPALDAAGRTGPLLLAVSFVLPAVVLVVAWITSLRRGVVPERRTSVLLRVLAGWTVVVWVVRGADIALGGDHPVGFVVVHLVLAIVSIGLAVWAVLADRSDRSDPSPTRRSGGAGVRSAAVPPSTRQG